MAESSPSQRRAQGGRPRGSPGVARQLSTGLGALSKRSLPWGLLGVLRLFRCTTNACRASWKHAKHTSDWMVLLRADCPSPANHTRAERMPPASAAFSSHPSPACIQRIPPAQFSYPLSTGRGTAGRPASSLEFLQGQRAKSSSSSYRL